MDSIILLDIPQGAITIASAVIVVFFGALVTLAIWIFRLLYSIQGRVTALETKLASMDPEKITSTIVKMNILWEEYRNGSLPGIRSGIMSPENPMLQERWEELLIKLEKDQLPDDEAEELLAAFLKRREQAFQEGDIEVIRLLGHGIVLVKWQLKETELRKK